MNRIKNIGRFKTITKQANFMPWFLSPPETDYVKLLLCYG